MDMTNPTFQLLAYELATIFAVLAFWLLVKAYKNSKRLRSEAEVAVKNIKRNKNRRLDDITELLSVKYHLQGPALSQIASEIQKLEQQVYKSQLPLYVDQDNKVLKSCST
jgi:hypothetical protein